MNEMQVIKCDICGVEMDAGYAEFIVGSKNEEIENKKICINCHRKNLKKFMQFFDKGKVE